MTLGSGKDWSGYGPRRQGGGDGARRAAGTRPFERKARPPGGGTRPLSVDLKVIILVNQVKFRVWIVQQKTVPY
jgi:hypothetical protein